MTRKTSQLMLHSWLTDKQYNKTSDILNWIKHLNDTVSVDIKKTSLVDTKWFYDEQAGQIVNERGTFFQISGIRNGEKEQPILIQNEIGYLGILCKPIDGILHFLIQAKIEPGNVNNIQLSPTLQATKSNFTQAHGGVKPAYLEWFLNCEKHEIVVDQIQSEQSSRFLGKRNRNIIIILDEDIEIDELPSHKWLTLRQIKQLIRIDNLVNMDTRTVLSCIPFYKCDFSILDSPLAHSISQENQPEIVQSIYCHFNNYKMFNSCNSVLVPLYSIKNWETKVHNGVEEFVSKSEYPFKIVFCNISIEGREVRCWGQPLFEATGMAVFGLFARIHNGVYEFLVRAMPEIGCFDKIELGPTVQLEAVEKAEDSIGELFFKQYNSKHGIICDVILSEEGGRFYHEQNRNVIIEIEDDVISTPPPGYWWCTYRTLNKLTQINNILNIQLRNLLSLLEVKQ
ncbi:MAG: NDP-hexose 2,3-dehydratase family protein [Oscillospiraceae bacterium]|nr:NDP-hexose 2,3-dehydratase family protein [Oscillospiraceae bacterium]